MMVEQNETNSLGAWYWWCTIPALFCLPLDHFYLTEKHNCLLFKLLLFWIFCYTQLNLTCLNTVEWSCGRHEGRGVISCGALALGSDGLHIYMVSGFPLDFSAFNSVKHSFLLKTLIPWLLWPGVCGVSLSLLSLYAFYFSQTTWNIFSPQKQCLHSKQIRIKINEELKMTSVPVFCGWKAAAGQLWQQVMAPKSLPSLLTFSHL